MWTHMNALTYLHSTLAYTRTYIYRTPWWYCILIQIKNCHSHILTLSDIPPLKCLHTHAHTDVWWHRQTGQIVYQYVQQRWTKTKHQHTRMHTHIQSMRMRVYTMRENTVQDQFVWKQRDKVSERESVCDRETERTEVAKHSHTI